MSTQQVLVGISFEDKYRAQEFLTATKRLNANEALKVVDAVIVAKDDEGKTNVVETIDPTPGRSALSGAMWTGLLGLLVGGPVGWIAGAAIGAGAGAGAAKVIDLGISDEWVAWFRQAVEPGTSTVALLVEDLNEAALVAEAERFSGAELVYANLEPEGLNRLADALGSDAPDYPASETPDPDAEADSAEDAETQDLAAEEAAGTADTSATADEADDN